jgi:DNA primase
VPAFVPDHILEQIRQSADIVDVIHSYVPLKRAGANFRALCPFHKEKTPSFNVHPARQIWHCFGCGAGGDVFKFLMMYENIDFPTAVRRLAERAGVPLEFETSAEERATRSLKDELFALHEAVASHFHALLLRDPSAEIARDYLKKRGITSQTCKKFRIGFSPQGWDGLFQWAKTKNLSAELLEKAGLVLKSDKPDAQNSHYDRFRGRLMFSICDEQGRVVGFSGRILTDEKDQPKYVNSPETPIFQKSKVLFGLDKAKRAILDAKFAVVCEGQLDMISCFESGIENVVAPQGTALTEQHGQILKRYVDEVVLAFDSDEAGQNAAARSVEALLPSNLVVRVAVLPRGEDPDSLIRKEGAAAMRKLIDEAKPYFDFFLDRLSKERGKMQIAAAAAEYIRKIPNAVLRADHIRVVSERLHLPESAIAEEFHKSQRRPRMAAADANDAKKSAILHVPPAEKFLLELLLHAEPPQFSRFCRVIQLDWVTDETVKSLVSRILELETTKKWRGAEPFLHELDNEAAALVTELLMKPTVKGEFAAQADDCVRQLQRRFLQRQIEDRKHRLRRADMPLEEALKLQQQILDLRRDLEDISPPLNSR